MPGQAQAAKEQRLQIITADDSNVIKLLNPTSKSEQEEWKTIKDMFAANWTIQQMVQIGDQRVLLLLERVKLVKKPAPF